MFLFWFFFNVALKYKVAHIWDLNITWVTGNLKKIRQWIEGHRLGCVDCGVDCINPRNYKLYLDSFKTQCIWKIPPSPPHMLILNMPLGQSYVERAIGTSGWCEEGLCGCATI